MCGLVGFVGYGGRSDIEAMTRSLAHRGPDGEGVYIDTNNAICLGHRRLAIIDIDHGAQPMWSGDGAYCVVYNGEIYNHLDLRNELLDRGYKFQTDHCDTEVLLHGFAEWGRDLPSRLNGMFAFAIWDVRKKTLFLARDRFGEKPLYWGKQNGLFVFASELSALSRHSSLNLEVNPNAIKKLLAYGYIPAPFSYFKNIQKLPGGTWLEFDFTKSSVRVETFWRYAIEPEEPSGTEKDVAEELKELLVRAVDRRLMSDVSVGFFLSGGLDSSAVLACAKRARLGAKFDTFSIGFEEKSYDESSFARMMALDAESNHSEKILTIKDAFDLIPDLLEKLDEPFSDSSIIPTYLLSGFAKQSVKVALGGDGSDELFAGYDTFAALKIARIYRKFVPTRLHRQARRLIDLVPKASKDMALDFKMARALRGVGYRPDIWNPMWISPLEPDEISEIICSPVDIEELYSEAIQLWENSASTNDVDRASEFFVRYYLQDDILLKVDRASMMNGLEARAPFLDNDLVEFARRLPAHYKLRGSTRKYILKKAVDGLIPEKLINRKKGGFRIPIRDWIGPLIDRAPTKSLPYLNDGAVQKLFNQHMSGGKDQRVFLWTWFVLSYFAARPNQPNTSVVVGSE